MAPSNRYILSDRKEAKWQPGRKEEVGSANDSEAKSFLISFFSNKQFSYLERFKKNLKKLPPIAPVTRLATRDRERVGGGVGVNICCQLFIYEYNISVSVYVSTIYLISHMPPIHNLL